MKKGEKMSPEQRQKIAKAHIGMKATLEARQKSILHYLLNIFNKWISGGL